MGRTLTQAERLEFSAYRRAMDYGIAKAASDAQDGKTPGEINDLVTAVRDWVPGTYKRYDVRNDGGIPYWALHDHDSALTPDQRPSTTQTMWAHYHGTDPVTARPFIAEGHNPYMTGHYCTENGEVWRCKVDNVIHAPSILPGSWAQT